MNGRCQAMFVFQKRQSFASCFRSTCRLLPVTTVFQLPFQPPFNCLSFHDCPSLPLPSFTTCVCILPSYLHADAPSSPRHPKEAALPPLHCPQQHTDNLNDSPGPCSPSAAEAASKQPNLPTALAPPAAAASVDRESPCPSSIGRNSSHHSQLNTEAVKAMSESPPSTTQQQQPLLSKGAGHRSREGMSREDSIGAWLSEQVCGDVRAYVCIFSFIILHEFGISHS